MDSVTRVFDCVLQEDTLSNHDMQRIQRIQQLEEANTHLEETIKVGTQPAWWQWASIFSFPAERPKKVCIPRNIENADFYWVSAAEPGGY